MPQAVIIIPARMTSTRFPNKPLAKICGIPMIERVWKIAKLSNYASRVIIATDDAHLANIMAGIGAEIIMTSAQCLTGTDRVAEALVKLDRDYEVVFSLQGDAVLTPPWIIDEVLQTLLSNPHLEMATPAILLEGLAKSSFVELKNQGASTGTCVVFDKNNRALYFSKALIPHARSNTSSILYRHIGLYGYRPDALLKLHQLPQSPLEKVEQLEQLRALENGITIHVCVVDYRGRTHGSVDRPEDVPIVEEIIKNEGELIDV